MQSGNSKQIENIERFYSVSMHIDMSAAKLHESICIKFWERSIAMKILVEASKIVHMSRGCAHGHDSKHDMDPFG